MQSEPTRRTTEEYREYTKKQRALQVLVALTIVLPWFPELFFGQINLIVAVLLSFAIASVLIFLLSFFQVRIERKYRQVTATQRDYFVTDLPLYFVALVPGLFVLGFEYMLPRFGLMTMVYADAIVLAIYLIFARFPIALRMGQRATPMTDEQLLSSFRALSNKMRVDNVSLYSVDWKRFKVANAFQVGPRKFSVFVSNYLLENMSKEEVIAVMAHELAHSKKRHVAKSLALFVFPSLAALDVMIVGTVIILTNIWGIIPFVAGLISMFLLPQLALRFQRKFELEADEIATRTLGDGTPMISALRKLANLNLIAGYKGSPTHPSMTKRIERIEQISKSLGA